MVIAGSLINIAVSWLFGIGFNMGVVGICIGYGADILYLKYRRYVRLEAPCSYPQLSSIREKRDLICIMGKM